MLINISNCGFQLAAAQQESYYQQCLMNTASGTAPATVPETALPVASHLTPKFSNMLLGSSPVSCTMGAPEEAAIFPPLPTENSLDSAEPENMSVKLRERCAKIFTSFFQNFCEIHIFQKFFFRNNC